MHVVNANNKKSALKNSKTRILLNQQRNRINAQTEFTTIICHEQQQVIERAREWTSDTNQLVLRRKKEKDR
jgi:hypothetical protein